MADKKTIALNERDSAAMLRQCGVNMVPCALLEKEDEAAFAAAAESMGFPMAMKVLSDDILHKTDVGCVVLGVNSIQQMHEAYRTILDNAAKNAPGAKVQGVLAQKMLPKGRPRHHGGPGRCAGGAAPLRFSAGAAHYPGRRRGYDR